MPPSTPYINTTYPLLRMPLESGENIFTFTAKERDEETGFNYHGARYYDASLLTGWLSVDPLADKYPSMSPYNYCAWNPVKLVDLDGRETNPVFGSNGKYRGCTKEGYTGDIIIYDGHLSFRDISADELVSKSRNDSKKAEVYTYSQFRNTMSDAAKSRMYTHIAKQMNGYRVGKGKHMFDISKLSGNKIFFNENASDGGYVTNINTRTITATEKDFIPLNGGHGYEATVENIQASIIIHEWYGHIECKWGDRNRTHRNCYSAVWNDPIFSNCTENYQDFIRAQYQLYNDRETSN